MTLTERLRSTHFLRVTHPHFSGIADACDDAAKRIDELEALHARNWEPRDSLARGIHVWVGMHRAMLTDDSLSLLYDMIGWPEVAADATSRTESLGPDSV